MITATRLFVSAMLSTMRILEENRRVLFCAKDTAKTLGSVDTAKAMTKHSEKRGGQYAQSSTEWDTYKIYRRGNKGVGDSPSPYEVLYTEQKFVMKAMVILIVAQRNIAQRHRMATKLQRCNES